MHGNNLANFQVTTSRFCMVLVPTDYDDNGHNSSNFQVRISRFCMTIDLDSTYYSTYYSIGVENMSNLQVAALQYANKLEFNYSTISV